jgi:cobalt/nickel transport system permease protein
LRAFKPVAVLLTVVGLCSLPFDRAVLLHAGPLSVTGGMLSLGVLLAKGLFCFLAVWVLIASTGMESVCAALQQLHCPRVLTTIILLIYRYIVLLLQEGIRIATAYALRAPGQKGIQFRAWGSLLGQLLLRSIDRAQLVYESMQLRGFAGSFPPGQKKHGGWLFLAVTVFYCAVFRAVPVFELAGRLL